MPFVSFMDADSIGDRFLNLLSGHGIQPPPGSWLEKELLSLTHLVEMRKNPNLAQGDHQVKVLREAVGLHDLAAKVLSVEPLPEFSRFLPHLRLISETKVYQASLAQNMASGPCDDTARKMAELYIGCLAAHVGTDVNLDSPTNAKGDNPDVIFTIEAGDEECTVVKPSQRWALAIKTISTKVGQTIFERIKEGAAQIDDPKCPAERGMVVINTKGSLDHDVLWETIFPNLQSAMVALGGQLDRLAESADTDREQAEWEAIFSGRVVRPVLFLGQSAVRVATPVGSQTPTALKMLKVYGANGALNSTANRLASQLNDYMQTILRGIPAGSGCPPQ